MNAHAYTDGPLGPLPTIRWTDDRAGVIVLDQTELPGSEVYRELRTLEDVHEAITSLRVRGAPLIGITAAMGVAALAAAGAARTDAPPTPHDVAEWCRRLAGARPTAVNLAWALERMAAVAGRGSREDPQELARALRAEAASILEEDAATCRRIGEHSLPLLNEGASVLTHCNAGALATGGIGTALAPLYLAHEAGRTLRVFSSETRPLLQGSRLTAWELGRAGIDVTVITDNMAGALFGARRPDVVLVGADRIAANGDVANKVGTYALAVLARHHEVPFWVLAPTSTVDLGTPTGADISIELREPEEVSHGFGRTTVAPGAHVWSPAFDVTPAKLLSGIVTERGVHAHPLPRALAEAVREAEAARAGRRVGGGEPEP